MPDTLMTPKALAERWALSEGHLANMRSERKGPAYLKLGGAIRYERATVEAYEAAGRIGAAA